MRRVTAADGTSIAYEVFGRSQGTPVVMLQGLGTDSRGWALQRFAFGRRHRCYAVDNRGVGGSAGAPRPFSLEQMADDAVAVLDAEGVERAHVMGASMGGVIAQMLAVRHPARVRSLVLACTSCRHHEWRRELFQEWADEVEARGMGALGGDGLVWLVGPRLHRRFGLWINLLARIAVPTLVITGSQDLLTPLGDAEELAELIPDARLRELRGAAHGLMVEQPNAFNGAVLRFLDEVDEAGASTAGGDAGSGSGVADAPSAAAVDEAFNQTA